MKNVFTCVVCNLCFNGLGLLMICVNMVVICMVILCKWVTTGEMGDKKHKWVTKCLKLIIYNVY